MSGVASVWKSAGWRRSGGSAEHGRSPASSLNALQLTITPVLLMRPCYWDVEVGDEVAVNPPQLLPAWQR